MSQTQPSTRARHSLVCTHELFHPQKSVLFLVVPDSLKQTFLWAGVEAAALWTSESTPATLQLHTSCFFLCVSLIQPRLLKMKDRLAQLKEVSRTVPLFAYSSMAPALFARGLTSLYYRCHGARRLPCCGAQLNVRDVSRRRETQSHVSKRYRNCFLLILLYSD